MSAEPAEVVIRLQDPRDTLKMLRETLCVAQTALQHLPYEDPREDGHRERIGRIIAEIDRQRPLGSDGKHGDRHTATCGCETYLRPSSAGPTVAKEPQQ